MCSFREVGRERARLSLLVPLFDPVVGADGPEALVEVLARLVVIAADVLAAVEVQVVLVAVPGKRKKGDVIN
jgi:hypothetical protein